jgi:hypothetical protein
MTLESVSDDSLTNRPVYSTRLSSSCRTHCTTLAAMMEKRVVRKLLTREPEQTTRGCRYNITTWTA